MPDCRKFVEQVGDESVELVKKTNLKQLDVKLATLQAFFDIKVTESKSACINLVPASLSESKKKFEGLAMEGHLGTNQIKLDILNDMSSTFDDFSVLEFVR